MLEIKKIAHRSKVGSVIKNRAKPGSWKPISKSINNSVGIFRRAGRKGVEGKETEGRKEARKRRIALSKLGGGTGLR